MNKKLTFQNTNIDDVAVSVSNLLSLNKLQVESSCVDDSITKRLYWLKDMCDLQSEISGLEDNHHVSDYTEAQLVDTSDIASGLSLKLTYRVTISMSEKDEKTLESECLISLKDISKCEQLFMIVKNAGDSWAEYFEEDPKDSIMHSIYNAFNTPLLREIGVKQFYDNKQEAQDLIDSIKLLKENDCAVCKTRI